MRTPGVQPTGQHGVSQLALPRNEGHADCCASLHGRVATDADPLKDGCCAHLQEAALLNAWLRTGSVWTSG